MPDREARQRGDLLRDLLRPVSDSEYAQIPQLEAQTVVEALEQGRAERLAAERNARQVPTRSRLRFR